MCAMHRDDIADPGDHLLMGHLADTDGEGLEFLGLTQSSGSPATVTAASEAGAPMTRREARERATGALPRPSAPVAPPAVPTALQPTSGAALLHPEYVAQRVMPTESRQDAPAAARETASLAATRTVPARTKAPKAPKPSKPSKAAKQAKAAKAPRGRVSRVRARDIAPPKARNRAPKLMSLVALLFAGALIVAVTVPANAFMSDAAPLIGVVANSDVTPLQSIAVSGDSNPAATARDSFSVVSYAALTQAQYGHLGTFTPTTGSIRWPFPYSVPISDGYGPRIAPCDGCSTFHKGVDFTPGYGTPIYAVADGVVEAHSGDSQWEDYGNHLVIKHSIPGQNVESLYAHMVAQSSKLQPGDPVKVGDFIGLVGDTGSSTGAHLHFEIFIDGVNVDPYAWLVDNATDTP
ncbi:MAG: peptidoglycan DD-metalloendopeptidase family protein [Rhodoglobus sp.]